MHVWGKWSYFNNYFYNRQQRSLHQQSLLETIKGEYSPFHQIITIDWIKKKKKAHFRVMSVAFYRNSYSAIQLAGKLTLYSVSAS